MSLVIDIFFLLFFILLCLYLAALYYLRRGLIQADEPNNDYHPAVSIIVSMHNEEDNVRECIQHLIVQNYPSNKLEIIIVNDRSTDKTADIIPALSNKNLNLTHITITETPDTHAPKKFAIDQAIQRANGEIIILTDADGRPGPQWARTIVSQFSRNVGMVIGYAPYITEPPYNKLPYHLLSLEYLSHAAIACASTGLNYPLTCVGTNMAYRRDVYNQLGGFGEFKHIHTGDDDLFLQRVREETDWRIIYNTKRDGQVWNAPPVTLKKFIHQRLRYASKGFLYPRSITISLIAYYILNFLFVVSPLFFLYSYFYILPFLFLIILKVFGDYQFLSRAASVLRHRKHIKLFPFAFILHIPYVLIFGFLSQIKQFEWGSRKS